MKYLFAVGLTALVIAPLAGALGFTLNHPATKVVTKDRPVREQITATWSPSRFGALFDRLRPIAGTRETFGKVEFICRYDVNRQQTWLNKACVKAQGGAAA